MRTGGHGPRSSTLRNTIKQYQAPLREQRKEAWLKAKYQPGRERPPR
ncbi:MAG: hypothetical protein QOK29_3670 [Rhodospirillaceae bacterium]|jgi:hypothetical protein|nr:hypothetical protein [Rhodospirillaceae bacterium]